MHGVWSVLKLVCDGDDIWAHDFFWTGLTRSQALVCVYYVLKENDTGHVAVNIAEAPSVPKEASGG